MPIRLVAVLLVALIALAEPGIAAEPGTTASETTGPDVTEADAGGPDATEPAGTKPEGPLHFRFVGPRVGNRIAAIAGVAGDPSTYYAGAASGGIWKSTDGGNRWAPVFDDQPVAAIGALAVAPGDPNTVWAGTGEAWVIRDSDVMGNGIYKSTDAGKTWSLMGLPESGRIGRIIVHPRDADIVYACVLGRTTGPQAERGVYRTTDGGRHWARSLFAGENVGCSGLAMDPSNPRTLIAGMWQVEMHTWGEFSGGPGSGLWISHDGGDTWKRIRKHGLPEAPLGKIDVAIAPTNGQRIYALIQTRDQGSVWRSDDGGSEWKAINHQRALIGRAGYYIRLAVSPASDNEVYVANSSFHQSLDGAENFHEVRWGGDTHDIWIDPSNADRFVITDDGGLIITTVHGRGFHRVHLPIGQTYHVAVDRQVPYFFYSNMQDDGNFRGPSVDTEGGETGWDHHMGGCESGFTVPDQTDPAIVWATCYGNKLTRWDAHSRQAHSLSPWMHTLDSPPNTLKYRCHWTAPLAIDPFDHDTVYYGCQVVWRTTDAGAHWAVASPDLSTQNPAHIVPSGGIVGDNLGQFYGEVVFAIAPSPREKGLVWAGTNDGQLWLTRDGTATWTNVTKSIPGLPADGTVTSIAPSTFDAGTAYVSFDFHLADNRDPFIYKTADYGRSWKRIDAKLPRHALSYVRSVTEDPAVAGLLFAGTGNGLYTSPDDGAHWEPLQEGLPHAPVSWVVVQPDAHDLVVSTYGRGLYILDDLTALEARARHPGGAAPELYAPRAAYRFSKAPQAYVNYALASESKDPPLLEILDASGAHVRTLEAKGKAGLNRVEWNLRYDSPRVIAMRTVAPDNTRIWSEPRFRDADSRPITHWGSKPAEVGPIVAPGTYTVKLTVGGSTLTQPLTVLRDPRSPGTDADLSQSVATLRQICADISSVADTVNEIEWLRRQLEIVKAMLGPARKLDKVSPVLAEEDDEPDKEPTPAPPKALSAAEQSARDELLAASVALADKLQAVESKFVSKALQNSDDKYFVEPYGVYMNLIWLNAEVGTGGGDVAGSADFAPTANQLELLANYQADAAAASADYATILRDELPAFNRKLEAAQHAPLAPGL